MAIARFWFPFGRYSIFGSSAERAVRPRRRPAAPTSASCRRTPPCSQRCTPTTAADERAAERRRTARPAGAGRARRHSSAWTGRSTGHVRRGVRRLVDLAGLGMAVALREDARRRRGDHGDGDDERQADGAADGHGDVAEELPHLVLQEEDRDEDGERGERRGHDRAPDLLRALHGGVEAALAHLVAAVDVLEHDDRVVDEHADGEGQAGEADHVEGAAQQPEQHERPDDAGGDRERDDERGTQAWGVSENKSGYFGEARFLRGPPTAFSHNDLVVIFLRNHNHRLQNSCFLD